MDPCETTNLLLSRIKSIDPDNASKILGFILIHDLGDRELASLAVGHETHLLNFISKARTHLNLSLNTSSATSAVQLLSSSPSSPLNPISRPVVGNCAGNPFSSHHHSSPKFASPFVGFSRNNPSSPHSWPVSANNSISSSGSNNCSISLSPKSSPFLSYDSIRAAGPVKSPAFSKSSGNADSSSNDALEDYPFDEYLSFLDDSSSRNDDFVDPAADSQLHRRRFSESDACPDDEDDTLGIGYNRPCLNNRVMVGSPREMESLYLQQHEGMMRLKAAQQQQQRLVYSKYMNFLLHQHNDQHRLGAAAAMNREEFHKFGRFCTERNDFFAMAMAEKANSASRQIYLTFPAESTFRDEDVSNYFSTFGPVEDVRIPYQQKRMFGFVTFVHPDTVKQILARGNPHFICDSRVLVKPYKEKGKASNERQHHMHQQLVERGGSLSSCSSPSGLDGRELYDLPMGPRIGYNSPEMMLRRKLDEHAELQQAIELQGRRLVNLQLPDLRGDYVQHQRSLSVGAPISMPSPLSQRTCWSHEVLEETVKSSDAAFSATEVNPNLTLICNKEERINHNGSNMNNCNGNNAEHELKDNLVSSRPKSPGKQNCNCSPLDSSLENTSDVSSTSPHDATSR